MEKLSVEIAINEFSRLGMPACAAFVMQQRHSNQQVLEMGSSSIDPQYADSLDKVVLEMGRKFAIYPKGLRAQVMFRQMGDPSGMFYIGGYKFDTDLDDSEEQKAVDVNALEYMLYLAAIINELPIQVLADTETIIHSLTSAISRIHESMH